MDIQVSHGGTIRRYTPEALREALTGQFVKLRIDAQAKSDDSEWVTVDKILAALPGDNTSHYWLKRGNQVSGPYPLENLRHWVVDHSRRVLITDLAKNIAMADWVSVDKLLAGSAAPASHSLTYEVLRNGKVSGPYTLDQLRGGRLPDLGPFEIGDLVRTPGMPQWMNVSDILAWANSDSTTNYWLSRKGQIAGPLTLAVLQEWAATGRVESTDLAKNIAMTDWVPVGQVLGGSERGRNSI